MMNTGGDEDAGAPRAPKASVAEAASRDGLLQFALGVSGLGYWELDTATQTARRSPRHDQIFGYDTPLPEWT